MGAEGRVPRVLLLTSGPLDLATGHHDPEGGTVEERFGPDRFRSQYTRLYQELLA
jgi:hypothetical protein